MIDRTKWKIILLPAEHCMILQEVGSVGHRGDQKVESELAAEVLTETIVLESSASGTEVFLKHQHRFKPTSEVARRLELQGSLFLNEVECVYGMIWIKDSRVFMFEALIVNGIRDRGKLFASITTHMGVTPQKPKWQQKLFANVGFAPNVLGIWESNGIRASVGVSRDPEDLWLSVKL